MNCSCQIIKRNGNPLTTADYDKDSPNAPSHIQLCPLHAAADEMVEALRALADASDNERAAREAHMVKADKGQWKTARRVHGEAVMAARAALRSATGKP